MPDQQDNPTVNGSGPDSPTATTVSEAPALPLLEPADGVPPVVETPQAVEAAAAALRAGYGPLAVDAERASGFRYSNRAYLVQLRRAGAGTILLDPIPVADHLDALAEVINDLEWVLHAADQDLACLDELGLRPRALFDTELGGRLAGYERVGLAAMIGNLLGFHLAKGHGADDWSTRPLPDDWLTYAALDVELLLELREKVAADLEEQGKLGWALEEFEHVRTTPPSGPRPDRWRRTSGLQTLKSTRQLAAVRELWIERDEIAAQRDISPGRVLPDTAIINAAKTAPRSRQALVALPIFSGSRQRRRADRWYSALQRARDLPEADLPPRSAPFDGPPPANRWARKDPEAAARLTAARAALREVVERQQLPLENVLTPDLVRRLCWTWPADLVAAPDRPADVDRVRAHVIGVLTAGGARQWQLRLAVEPLTVALSTATVPSPEPQEQPQQQPGEQEAQANQP